MPEDLTDKELKWGYWWVLHRQIVRRAVEVGLGIVALALCGYALWQIVDWLANRQAEEEALRQIINRQIDLSEYKRTNSPLALEIGTVTAVPSLSGYYDLVAEVKNPNIKWAIQELPFTFSADGQSATGTSFFLPLEDKYLLKLGVPFKSRPTKVNLTFGDFSWQRVRNLEDLPIPTFDISSEEIEQVKPADAGAPTATRLRFKLANTSPYSYWQVKISVILSRTGSIQAVGQQVISDVTSQSVRPVEFFWPTTVVSADNLIIKPEVNVLDARVLK